MRDHAPTSALYSLSRGVDLAGARVLIAEDNLVNMEVAKFHLEDLGCIFEGAANGADAVSLYAAQPFDYVLMDCQMPVMDGYEALKRIRALEAERGLSGARIIAVTAADDMDARRACENAGFGGFLTKPYSAEQLRSTMQSGGEQDHAGRPAGCIGVADAAGGTGVSPVLEPTTFAAFIDDFGSDVAVSLVESFVKLLEDGTSRYAILAKQRDAIAANALAHKLAGAAGTLGAVALAELARQIDRAGKKGNKAWTPDIERLGAAIDEARQELAHLTTPHDLRLYRNRYCA